MKNLRLILFSLAALLTMGWIFAISFVPTGVYVHVCLIVAAISCMQAVIISPKASASC